MEDNTKAALRWWKILPVHEQTGLCFKYGVYDDTGYDCHKTPSDKEILFMWNGEISEAVLGPHAGVSKKGTGPGVKLPKQAQEGLKKIGEKIGESEWDEIFKEYSEDYSDVFGLQIWLKENYYPPKPKEK